MVFVVAFQHPTTPERRASSMRSHAALVLVGIAFVCVFVLGRDHRLSTWEVVGALLVAVLAAIVGYPAWRTHEPPEPPQADPREATQPLKPLDLEDAELFRSAQLLLQLPALTNRINHDVVAGDDVLFNTLEKIIDLPPYPKSNGDVTVPFYVPLLQVERGSLVDDLATDADVTVVASSRARALTFTLLSFLTEAYFLGGDDESTTPDYQSVRDRLREQLAIFRPVLEADGTLSPTSGAVVAAYSALDNLRRLTPVKAPGAWPPDLESILQLWEATFSTYVIFGHVEASPGLLASIEVRYTKALSIVEEPSRERRFERLKNTMRSLMGLRQYVIRLPIPFANGCSSYHFRFHTESDQYVFSARVMRDGQVTGATHSSTHGHLVVCEKDRTRTTHFAHIYLRPLQDVTSFVTPIVRLAMREKPPGVVGLVALVGITQLITQGVILFWYPTIFQTSGGPIEIAALLLAIPGLVAAWIANQMAPGRLRRLSLTAAVGIAFNGLAAAAGLVFATLGSFKVSGFAVWGLATGVGFERLWVFLLLLSVWVTGNVVLRWGQNTALFISRMRAPAALDRYTV